MSCVFQKIPTKHLHPTKSTFCYNYHWQQYKLVEGHHGCDFLKDHHSFSITKTNRKIDVSVMVFHGKYKVLDLFNPLSFSFFLSPKDLFTWLDIVVYMRAREPSLQTNSPSLDTSLPFEMISFGGFHAEQKLAGLWTSSNYSLLFESPVHHATGCNSFVLYLHEYQRDTMYSNLSHFWPKLIAGSLLQSTLMVSFATQNTTNPFYKLVSTVGKLKSISLAVCQYNSTVSILWLPVGQRTIRVYKVKKCNFKFALHKSVSHHCFRFFLGANHMSMQYTVLLRRSPEQLPLFSEGEMKKAGTSWFEASDFCKSTGGFLPIMRDTQELEEFLFILKWLNTPVRDAIYIGLQYSERNQVNFCMPLL